MEQAIGVIDSGVGGLTVVQELMRQLPKEELIYLGDTKRCPYGPRPAEEVKKFTWQMVDFLLQKDIKTLVVACNTATAFTIKELQERLKIPVIGVIQPGARAAIKSTKNNQIAIIGTEGTIRSDAYPKALKEIKSTIYVYSLACPLLVPMVEKGILTGEQAKQSVSQSLLSIRDTNQIDTLILGCTHYPLIKEMIQTVIGKNVTIVSSSEETARETSAILDVHQLLYTGTRFPNHKFYTTGNLNVFKEISNNIFRDHDDYIHSVTSNKAVIDQEKNNL